MTYLGIDPGLNGYAASLSVIGRVRFFPAPTLPTGKGARQTYDLKAMVALAASWKRDGVEAVLIEKQQPFPKQGMTSTFSTGYGYGAWKAALTAAGLSFEEVRPDAWKREMGIAGGEQADKKARAIEKAQSLMPEIDLRAIERRPGAKVPCPDKAEALLLAIHACRRRGQRGQELVPMGPRRTR